MTRKFDRAVAPMTRAQHLGVQVLIPRDATKGLVIERARKERELYRAVADLEYATPERIAGFVSASGALGRLPQIRPATAKALSRLVRTRARETMAKLAARKDLSPAELFVQVLAESHAVSIQSIKRVPGANLTTKQSLVAAVLAEPLVRIAVEAGEVIFRAVRMWEPVEGPAGLARRCAAVLRERARELGESADEAQRAPAPVLAELGEVLHKYADEMAPPSLETRDQLRALKDQVMRLPEPTEEGWGDPFATPAGEEPRSFEGDAGGLMIRLTVELWASFHDGSSADVWCLPTAPLWPLIWAVAPIMFTALEDLPGWQACIHDQVEVWRTFAKECRAWVRALDALHANELRSTTATREVISTAMSALFTAVRPALGESAELGDLVARDTLGERAALERLIELRCEAAGILPLSRSRVLGTEGRALWSIRAALCDERIVRRCAGVGCSNVLSVGAAPQQKKCIDCRREQGRKRVKNYRDRHGVARSSAALGRKRGRDAPPATHSAASGWRD
jgi:hypothetical protein